MNWEIHCNYVFVLFDFNGEMPEKVSVKGSCSYQTQKKLIGCQSCQLNKFEPAGHRGMMPQHCQWGPASWEYEFAIQKFHLFLMLTHPTGSY